MLPDPRILSGVGRASRGARGSWKSSLTWERRRPVDVVVVVDEVAVVVVVMNSILMVTTLCRDVNPKNECFYTFVRKTNFLKILLVKTGTN